MGQRERARGYLSQAEIKATLKGLSRSIERYAELIIRKGVGLQRRQELAVVAPVERADFVRLLVCKAYEAGSGHITVLWADDLLSRLEYTYNEKEYFEQVPAWKRRQLNGLAKSGAAFVFLDGSDPNALEGIDPSKITARWLAQNEQCRDYRNGLDFGKNAWCIAGVPVEAWAREVFADVPGEEAVLNLWQAILSSSRADGDDPQAEWERHNATFEKNKRILNEYSFDRLRYQSDNGTNLELGLNTGHVWQGGASRTADGRVFFANIPTEEVFTSPDRMRATGIVYATMPLVRTGRVIRDFWLRFEDGKVVDFDAREGADVLDGIIHADDTSCRLGECALVSQDTPIRRSGLLFYSTLYDENASCHLALGTGFPECIDNGFELNDQKLVSAGVNRSSIHVDFMVGSDDLRITGVTQTGEEVPVFERGRWAWYESS